MASILSNRECRGVLPHLLEARAAKADGGVEELVADARVHADGDGDLFDVGARLLAQRLSVRPTNNQFEKRVESRDTRTVFRRTKQ